MNSDLTVSVERPGLHPVLLLFASFPIACFTCALFTDGAYAVSENMLWADFSDWLLAAGVGGGVLAAIAGVAALITRRVRFNWAMAIGGVLVLAIAFLDNLVHSRDAWTSVMPAGLALSALTFVLILATLLAGARRRAATLYREQRP